MDALKRLHIRSGMWLRDLRLANDTDTACLRPAQMKQES